MPVRETGLYYLQSRYYNPTWGRFLNADGYTSTGQGMLGNNMFAYCLNNPVICYDPSGKAAAITVCCDTPDPILAGYIGIAGIGSIKRRQMSPSNPIKKVDITEKLNVAMLDHAMELSEIHEMYGGMAAALHFYQMVRTGGDWDFKSQEDWNLEKGTIYLYGGKELAYDDIGNIHYGFVGRMLFPEVVLLMGAGYAQISANTSSICFFQTYFDDPRDQEAIKFGFQLWSNGLYE